MKYIEKNNEPESLLKFRRKNKSYSNLHESPDIKRELKKSLLSEQGYICCYCECQISEDKSHIEHIKPQSKYKESDLSYENMLVSCDNKDRCGNKKGNWYDESNFISPLENDCANNFKFLKNGEMLPADKSNSAAKETIERLGLNTYNIVQTRKKIIKELEYCSIDEIGKILFEDGKYQPYYSAIKYQERNR